MSNPIIDQVNCFTPVDDFIGKGNDATYDEMDHIVEYIDEYISNLSTEKLEEEFETSDFDEVPSAGFQGCSQAVGRAS